MKILHVTDSDGIYGKEQVILNLIREHQKDGHESEVFILVKDNKREHTFEEALKSKGIGVWKYNTGKYNRAMVIRVLKEAENFDIVHVHDFKSSYTVAPRLKGPPVVKTVHGNTWTRRFSKKWLYDMIDRMMYRFHGAVVFVSETADVHFNGKNYQINNGIPKEYDATILDNDSLQEDIQSFSSDKSFIVGSFARLSKEKNIGYLLDIAEHAPYNIGFIILGSGPEKDILYERADRLSNVWMIGNVKDAAKYLKFIDLYIQPSLKEGTPMAVLEAARANVPMMLSSVGGMKSFTNRDAAIGLPLDSPKYVANMIEMYDEHPDSLAICVANAYQLFSKDYTSQQMARRYLDLYRSLL